MSISLRLLVVTPSVTHFLVQNRMSNFIEQTLKFRVFWSVKKLRNVYCRYYFDRQKFHVYFSF